MDEPASEAGDDLAEATSSADVQYDGEQQAGEQQAGERQAGEQQAGEQQAGSSRPGSSRPGEQQRQVSSRPWSSRPAPLGTFVGPSPAPTANTLCRGDGALGWSRYCRKKQCDER